MCHTNEVKFNLTSPYSVRQIRSVSSTLGPVTGIGYRLTEPIAYKPVLQAVPYSHHQEGWNPFPICPKTLVDHVMCCIIRIYLHLSTNPTQYQRRRHWENCGSAWCLFGGGPLVLLLGLLLRGVGAIKKSLHSAHTSIFLPSFISSFVPESFIFARLMAHQWWVLTL